MGVLQSCKRLSFSLTSNLMCCTIELFSYNDRVLCRYSFVKENSDFVYYDILYIGIILNDPFYKATVRCDFTLRYYNKAPLETAILKSPNILLCYFDTGCLSYLDLLV